MTIIYILLGGFGFAILMTYIMYKINKDFSTPYVPPPLSLKEQQLKDYMDSLSLPNYCTLTGKKLTWTYKQEKRKFPPYDPVTGEPEGIYDRFCILGNEKIQHINPADFGPLFFSTLKPLYFYNQDDKTIQLIDDKTNYWFINFPLVEKNV